MDPMDLSSAIEERVGISGPGLSLATIIYCRFLIKTGSDGLIIIPSG
jgi:hypothetical protein